MTDLRILYLLRTTAMLRGDIQRILSLPDIEPIAHARRQGLIEYVPGQGRADIMRLTDKGRNLLAREEGADTR